MSNLRDPALGLDCTETPLKPGRAISKDEIAKCNSCTLVFSAPNPGPKTWQVGPKNGIEIDESPHTQIIYNNQTFSLFKTFLWPTGIHRDFKSQSNYDMEMNLYFRDIFKPDIIIGVVIPITISDSQSKQYFNEWEQPTQTLESIVNTELPVLMYKGIDLRDRDSNNLATAPQCQNNSGMIWFILSSTYIHSTAAQKIRNYFSSSKYAKPANKKVPAENTPPVCLKELTIERIKQMCMIIPTINTKTNVDRLAKGDKVNNGIVLTRALQCQRIDPSTDIKGDAVYLKGPPQTNLQDEIDKATDLNTPLDVEKKGSIRAKSMENYLGIFLGIILGLVIFGIIGFFCMKYVYTKYESTVDTQLATIESSLKTLATAPGQPCPVPK